MKLGHLQRDALAVAKCDGACVAGSHPNDDATLAVCESLVANGLFQRVAAGVYMLTVEGVKAS